MTFLEARRRLLAELRTHVRNGHLTEREMARLTGVSQPHIHNVLKGVRSLSPEIADRILKTFHLSILDFGSPGELDGCGAAFRHRLLLMEMPVLQTQLGPNQVWKQEFSARERLVLPVPMQPTRPDLAALRMEHDPRMEAALGPGDLAVVNLASQSLFPLDPAGLYVIEISGGTAVRYLRSGATGVYVAAADALDSPGEWEIMDGACAVRARLLWIGNEKDRHLEVHLTGRVLGGTGW